MPLLTLGIPGSGTTAVMLGALLGFGIQPGPRLYQTNPEIFLVCHYVDVYWDGRSTYFKSSTNTLHCKSTSNTSNFFNPINLIFFCHGYLFNFIQ